MNEIILEDGIHRNEVLQIARQIKIPTRWEYKKRTRILTEFILIRYNGSPVFSGKCCARWSNKWRFNGV